MAFANVADVILVEMNHYFHADLFSKIRMMIQKLRPLILYLLDSAWSLVVQMHLTLSFGELSNKGLAHDLNSKLTGGKLIGKMNKYILKII